MTCATGIGPLPDVLEAKEGRKAVRRAFAAESVPLAVIEDRRSKLPLASVARLFHGAARAAGDPLLGLTVGQRMQPGEYGLWARYAMQAPTLGDAISRLVRTLRLHQSGTSMRVAPRAEGCVAWEYRQPDAPHDLFAQHTDHIIPVMIRVAQTYLGHAWRPAFIEVGYREPAHAPDLERATGAAWRFESSCQAIQMPAAALSAEAVQADGPAAGARRLSYRDVVAQSATQASFGPVDDIASVVALRLLDGESDIDGVARMLGAARRTLQRRLGDQGLTYRSLLTSLRMQRAKGLVEETDLPLKVIASELGYADPAHFTRAFGRHFGYPPSGLRPVVRAASG